MSDFEKITWFIIKWVGRVLIAFVVLSFLMVFIMALQAVLK